MRIESIAVERMNPTVYNPRIDLQPGDPEYEKLKRSITQFGYIDPIFCDVIKKRYFEWTGIEPVLLFRLEHTA